MNQDTLNSTEPILDEIAYLLDNLLDSEACKAIRQKLAEWGKVIGDNQSAKGYHHHQSDAIFLAGIPDLKATLPHA